MAFKNTATSAPAPSQASKRAVGDGPDDAIALLEADHREVEQLFQQFRDAEGAAQQRALAQEICLALKIHATLEEQLFYPAAMEATGESRLLQEALVEHAGAKDLIAQIETGAPGEPLFEARVTVLSEYIAHHVREEEGELFPKCRNSGLDLQKLGNEMLDRKIALAAGLAAPNSSLLLS